MQRLEREGSPLAGIARKNAPARRGKIMQLGEAVESALRRVCVRRYEGGIGNAAREQSVRPVGHSRGLIGHHGWGAENQRRCGREGGGRLWREQFTSEERGRD